MIYLKSFVAGLIAVCAAGMVVVLVATSILVFLSFKSQSEDSSIGFDIVAFGRSSLAWTIGLAAFTAGFVWEYRRILSR
jgi:hypothetical protein